MAANQPKDGGITEVSRKNLHTASYMFSGGVIAGINAFRYSSGDPTISTITALAGAIASLYASKKVTKVQLEGAMRTATFSSIAADSIYNSGANHVNWTMLWYSSTCLFGTVSQSIFASLKKQNHDTNSVLETAQKNSFTKNLKEAFNPRENPVKFRHLTYIFAKVPALFNVTKNLVSNFAFTHETIAKLSLYVALYGNIYSITKTPEVIDENSEVKKNFFKKLSDSYKEKPNRFGADTAIFSAVFLSLISPEILPSIIPNLISRNIKMDDFGRNQK
jgi:hypothetical protein